MKPLYDSITRLATLQARVKDGAPKPADYDETKIAPIRRLAILQVRRVGGHGGREQGVGRGELGGGGGAGGWHGGGEEEGEEAKQTGREQRRGEKREGALKPADYDETRIAPIRRLAILQVGGQKEVEAELGQGGWRREG